MSWAPFSAASFTSRSSSSWLPSERRGSSSSRLPTITVSRLLKSCAMPPVSWPIASRRWAVRAAVSRFSSRVTSRISATSPTPKFAASPPRDNTASPGSLSPFLRRKLAMIGACGCWWCQAAEVCCSASSASSNSAASGPTDDLSRLVAENACKRRVCDLDPAIGIGDDESVGDAVEDRPEQCFFPCEPALRQALTAQVDHGAGEVAFAPVLELDREVDGNARAVLVLAGNLSADADDPAFPGREMAREIAVVRRRRPTA